MQNFKCTYNYFNMIGLIVVPSSWTDESARIIICMVDSMFDMMLFFIEQGLTLVKEI